MNSEQIKAERDKCVQNADAAARLADRLRTIGDQAAAERASLLAAEAQGLAQKWANHLAPKKGK